MFRNLLPFISVLLLAVANASSFAVVQHDQSQPELPTLDQVKKQVESTLPAIVQFSYDGFGDDCGVIVSSEGHIAVCGPVGAVLDNKLLELRLTNGRRVRGQALGWSSEFGVGMLKITEPGEWKFVKISNQVRVGEICLALGYPRNHDDEDENLPRTRLGLVRQVYKDQWFDTSYQSDFSGHPVFNMNGELLGLQTSSDGTYSTFSSGRPIQDHWNELVSGLNIDRKRLFEETKPPLNFGELPRNISDDALAKAKAATVQIGDAGNTPVFSGVIVPGGYVITCAHHGRLPGDHLEITLADGRSANAIVRGTNRLTDTCLLKITDPGEWPYVNLGYSSLLPPGKSAVVIGYPINNDQRPLVLDLPVIERPRDGLKRRDSLSRQFYLECNDEKIVINLKGASGGGVFDSAGNVVGVISSTSSAWSHEGIFHGEIFNARVELIHKNWAKLADDSAVEVVDNEVQKSTLPSLTKLMSELEVLRQEH